MLFLITAIKLIAEVALMALLGQWLLGRLIGDGREQNLFYQVLRYMGRPFVELAGWVTPRVVLVRHHPLVAFLLLVLVWLAATFAKITHCLDIGVQLCR